MADLIIKDPYNHQVVARRKLKKPYKNWEKKKEAERRKAREKRNFCLRRAKQMAKNPTPYEALAATYLKEFGLRYSTQSVLYGYIPDFLLPRKVILEIDGGVHTTDDRKAHDFIRDKTLKQKGYRTVRITNEELSSPNGKEILKSRLEAVGLKV